jgi:hypothetical protein
VRTLEKLRNASNRSTLVVLHFAQRRSADQIASFEYDTGMSGRYLGYTTSDE